jgi:hypothetical protein
MSDPQAHIDVQTQTTAPEIIARPGTRYRITHYLVVLMILGMGIYCIRDGFWVYPREKARYDEAGTPYPALNIPFNRTMGILLPPAALALLIWTLYRSRGVYRLADDKLHIPGRPPIPLNAIRKIDKRKWDKKGIACIEYEVPGITASKQFCLDDYVYDRDPTDDILKRIEEHAHAMADR